MKRAVVDPSAVERLLAQARRDVDEGLLPSCQLALARHGQIVAAATFGDADDDSRYLVWSISKGITGAAAWALFSDGRLSPDDRVAAHLPGFEANGKGSVTVEHLMLHTAGFPRAPLRPHEWGASEGRRAAFTRWRLDWPAGSRYEYHAVSGYWVLAELIQTAAGEDYRRFLHRRVLDPLGLTRLRLGEPAEQQGDVLDMVLVGEAAPRPAGWTDAGLPPPGDRDLPGDDFAPALNAPAAREVGIPAGGALGRAVDVALYYQALLSNPEGLWAPAVLADATGVIRNRHPDPGRGGIPANRTRGLVVAGDDGHGWLRMHFGRATSPRTFGHDGAFGQVAWADPDTGLSFCYLTNGLDRNIPRHTVRSIELSTLAGACA